MAADGLDLTFIVEPDRDLGQPIWHLFPSHQPHEPLTTCSCRPRLSDMHETDPGVFMEIWWHWRKTPLREETDE